MTRRRTFIWICAVGSVLLCGQGWAQQTNTKAADGNVPLDPKFAAFAEAVESGIAEGNALALDGALDWNAFMERVLPEKDFNAETRRGAEAGMKKSFRIGRAVVQNVEAGGSYTVLRLYSEQNKQHVIFRFLMDSGGLNYHDLTLKLNRKGEVRYDDIYNYVGGENISVTMRRLMIPTLAGTQKNILEKLLAGENEYAQNVDKIAAMSVAIKNGNPARALKIFGGLPVALRKNKSILLVRLTAAGAVGTDSPEYQQAMDDFARLFPNDPSTYLVLIDSHMNRKEYDKLAADIDMLDKKVGGDPYLDVFRATGLMLQKKHAEARATVERAIKREPTLVMAYWNLVTIALDEKDWPEVTRGLTRIEKVLGLKLTSLEGSEEYAGYVKTDEYRKWMAGRTATPSPASKPERPPAAIKPKTK